MEIKQMDFEQRPRERLLRLGAGALSDYELLAILLGSGSRKKSVLDLALELVNAYGLDRLFSLSFQELGRIDGIKEAKATKLMACFEIARRCMRHKEEKKRELTSAMAVYEYVHPEYLFSKTEKTVILYVDSKCRVLHQSVFESELSFMVELPIRQIVKEAISYDAYGIFITHNHPTGEVCPSKADYEATCRLKEILEELQVELLDHVIVGGSEYFSFHDKNLLNGSVLE